jgi:hypothetical protein
MRSADSSAVACPRVAEGCATDRAGEPVTFDDGQGWVHRLGESVTRRPVERPPAPPTIDAGRIARRCYAQLGDAGRWRAARDLGLPAVACESVGMGWSGMEKAFTFPMFDSRGKVVGVRVRDVEGGKWAVRGSRNGLFMAARRSKNLPILLVVEGPTDTAAGVAMGLDVTGRPGNTSGNDDLVAYAVRWRLVVLLVDRDAPGSHAEELTQIGAKKTADALASAGKTVKICRPPEGVKDLREWYQAGATMREVLKVMTAGARHGAP